MRLVTPSVSLLWITPDAARQIERAARVCYKSEGQIGERTYATMVANLIKRGHTAMLEHASASMLFTVDRGVTHELVRHRIASFAQESTRYCRYSGDKFGGEISVIPMMDGLTPEQQSRRMVLLRQIEAVYMAEINEGVRPQQARDVLPTCLKADIVVTANFREWLHIFALRTSPQAHPQIRSIMELARGILRDNVPSVFGGSDAP